MSVRDWYARCAGIALLALPLVSTPNASNFLGGGYKYTTGLIYKQGLVIDENSSTGQPEFAIYNRTTGGFIETLASPGAEGEPYWIGNAQDYEASAAGFIAFMAGLSDEQRDAARVMSADEYTNDLPPGQYRKGALFRGTRWVLAYDPELLDSTVQLDSEQGLLLFQSRYDLDALENEPNVSERSLLFSDSGQIVERSNNTIGYRVAFIKPDGKGDGNERDRRYTDREDEPVAPVTNALVETGLGFNARYPTNEKGRYMAYYYIPPCPGFTFNYTIPIYVSIPYRTYNPQRKRGYGEYLFWGISDYTCIGPPLYPPSLTLGGVMSHVNLISELAARDDTPSEANFPIDVTLISGRFSLHNPVGGNNGSAGTQVPVGERTIRQPLPEPDPEQSDYQTPEPKDYNGDDQADHVSDLDALTDDYIKDIDDEERKKLYGVWFSKPNDATEGEGGVLIDANDEPIKPDLVRVADLVPNFEPIGLLEQVSEEDLLETDLYVFRESTGELVVEKLNFARNGKLHETPINGVDEQSSAGYFELTVPGQDAAHSFRSVYRNRSLHKDYEDWQASLGIQESLQGYKADSLRVGEPLTLVVINRATGYLGTASTSVLDVTERTINITLPDIKLFPPNLQVQVDRQYEVDKGLTAGETRHYRVGSEGAALTSDQYVSIHTQWLNHDGTALPSELPGYTGRLANLVGDGQLNQSSANHFSIASGKHTEVIKLPNPALSTTAAHQYLHVVGREFNAMPDKPDFGADPGSEFPERPGKFVPVKVAIYDEEASVELQRVQKEIQAQNESSPQTLKQDSSVYRWVYRPEMQYSVFELDIEQIQVIQTDDENNEHARDLSESETPVLSGNDDTLHVEQRLLGSQYNALSLFGSDKSLLVSLEGYEQSVDPRRSGEPNSPWHFSDLGHLGDLGADDFLTLNLLKNNDGGNVLWEWAFDYLYIHTTDDSELNEFSSDTYFVFADDPEVNLSAGTVGYEYDSDGERRTVGIRWTVDGDGSMDRGRTVEEGQTGYRNTLTMSTVAGSKATVTASIEGDSTTEASFYEVMVLPGEPGRLFVETSGSVGLDGTSSMKLTAKVWDRHGNIIPDNTPVGFSLVGHGRMSTTLAHTVDGIATASVTGGFSKGDGGSVVVDVNDETRTIDFSVASPRVSVTGVPVATRAGQRHEVVVQVTGPDGSPASNVFVSSAVDAGALSYSDGQHQTDDAGRIRFSWHTGSTTVPTATLTLRIGNEQLFEQRIPVASATVSTQLSPAQTAFTVVSGNTLVVGDRDEAGNVPISGIKPSTPDEFAFQIDDMISISNAEATINSTMRSTIGLGSISHPNRSPLLALDGSVLRRFGFQDDTGLIDITATGVTRVSNSPQAGTHSYSFDPDQSSRLSTTLSPSSKAQMGQLWVYPRAGGGSLARIGSSLNLTLQSNRQITLAVSILTDGEIQQVQVNSDPIEMNQWHFVAYHLEDDRLTLVVDGQSSETALTRDAAYQSHTAELEFGRGYDGLMSAMRWYSMDSAPLLTFADGRERVEIELTGAATRELNVLSTDSLNIGTSGTLAAHTVALTVDDQVTGSLIQVVAADEVARASGVLIDTIAPSLDWNAFKSLYRQSGAKSARALYRRVIAQSVDTSLPGYSELNAVTALLSVLNGLPEHGDLNASLGTILAFYTDHENNPTLRSATARYLYSAIEPMLVNEKVRLDRLAVPLTVLAEMLDVSPIAGFRLASSIKSEADFNTWMQYFSLPADGWTGVLPPVPSMGLACDDTHIPVVEGSVTELDMPLLACRATGRQAADLVDILWGVSSIVEEDPQIVVATMQELLDALPVADLFVRKALFPNTDQDVGSGLKWLPINNANAAAPVVAAVVARVAIRVGIWGGRAAGVYVVGRAIRSEVKQQLNNFLRGRNSRIHPLVLMGATSYLESRFDEGNNANCGGDTTCKSIREPLIIKAINDTKTKWERRLLLNYIRDEIDSKGEIQCAIDLDAFGAAFELWAAAMFHMRYERLEEDYYELVGMQARYVANLRSFDLGGDYDASINRFDFSVSEAKEKDEYVRFADIVIKGDNDLPILVELKSYKIPVKEQKKLPAGKKFTVVKDAFINRTPPFDPNNARYKDGTRKKTSMHRQILLDMFLTREQPGKEDGDEALRSGEDFRWYFQDWKPKYDEKSEDLNKTVGVSMTDVSVIRDGTDYTGMEMVAARLSALGAKKPGRKMLGYNLELSKSAVDERVRKFPGPLFNDIGTGNLGLKSRVKNFQRFGGITKAQRIKLVKNVFGVKEDSVLGQLILGENPELLQTVEEHLDAVDELIDSGRDAVLNLIVDPDTRELVEAQLEDLEELLVTTKEQIIEVGIGVLPDGTDGGDSCL